MRSRGAIRGVRIGLAGPIAALLFLPVIAFAQAPGGKGLTIGRLLVARGQVPDGRFRHAVVLLVGLSSKGAAGLVINQPGKTPLSRLFPKTPSAQERSDVAFAGGPVETGRLFCLLRIAGPLHEATAVLPGLYASDNRNLMELALNAVEPGSSFRVYQGYAGWKPGQLQRELAAGYWTVLPATPALIFDPDPLTLWARLSAPPATRRRPDPLLCNAAQHPAVGVARQRPVFVPVARTGAAGRAAKQLAAAECRSRRVDLSQPAGRRTATTPLHFGRYLRLAGWAPTRSTCANNTKNQPPTQQLPGLAKVA